MNTTSREIAYTGFLFGATIILHHLTLFLPSVLVFPAMLVSTVEAPGMYLIIYAFFGELLSTAPGGLMLAATFTPWLLFRAFRPVPDLSITYALALLGIITSQLLILHAPYLFSHTMHLFTATTLPDALPWGWLIITLLSCTLSVFTASVLVHYNKRW